MWNQKYQNSPGPHMWNRRSHPDIGMKDLSTLERRGLLTSTQKEVGAHHVDSR